MMLLALLGCDLFDPSHGVIVKVVGPDTGIPDDLMIDLLFVVDNSSGMHQIVGDMALGANEIVSALAAAHPQTNFSVTTTSLGTDAGASPGVDAGEAGTLLGPAEGISLADSAAPDLLVEILLCQTGAIDPYELEHDFDFVCGETPTSLSLEWVECVCAGPSAAGEGLGQESGIGAVFTAMCRDDSDLPSECTGENSVLVSDDVGTNGTFWRTDSVWRALIVTSEGDSSPGLSAGDPTAGFYSDSFDSFGHSIAISVLGPTYDADSSNGSCLDGALTWGVERYQDLAEKSGGQYQALTLLDETCTPVDISVAVMDLAGNLLE